MRLLVYSIFKDFTEIHRKKIISFQCQAVYGFGNYFTVEIGSLNGVNKSTNRPQLCENY